MYADSLEIVWENGEKEQILLDQLTFSCIQQRLLRITVKDGRAFEIRSEHPRSAVKYQLFHQYLTN